MPGREQIDLDELSREIGFHNWWDMFWNLYFVYKVPMMRIEEYLGISRGTLKYRVKKDWPKIKLRPPGGRSHYERLRRQK